MFLFLKLYLAHLIGDFVLQFEELYQLKLRSQLGQFFHVLIHAILMLIVVLPYLDSPRMWGFIAAVMFVHYFQDNVKYRLQTRLPRHRFFLFVTDQIFHGLVVAGVMLLPESREVITFSGKPWNPYYTDNSWTLLAIAFIFTTFAGSYLLHSFRTNFIPNTRPDHYITNSEMSYALFERTLVTAVFLFCANPVFFGAALFIAVPRLFFPKLRSMPDFIFSYMYAGFIGLLFRIWI